MKIRFTCALVAAFGLGAAGAAVMRAQVPTAKAEKSAAGGLFIGTEGLGHVSPAAAAPFGAIQAGPDTSAFADRYVGDWPHTCGYQHPDRYLFRFSQNRFYGIGCGGDYVIGAPQVTGATIALPDGRTFRIRAKGLSESNLHVKSVRLNGRPVADWKLRHADIVCGGELEFEMGPEKHGRICLL